nr:MAG TPA: hypothetical protein [Caudoviricetes sp.]
MQPYISEIFSNVSAEGLYKSHSQLDTVTRLTPSFAAASS